MVECAICLMGASWMMLTEGMKKRRGTAANVFVVKVLGKLAAKQSTGGAFNPATATARALMDRDFRNLSIYWIGPIIGHILAALLGTYVFGSAQARPVLTSAPASVPNQAETEEIGAGKIVSPKGVDAPELPEIHESVRRRRHRANTEAQ
jgi:hypothetical protein